MLELLLSDKKGKTFFNCGLVGVYYNCFCSFFTVKNEPKLVLSEVEVKLVL